MSNIYPHFIKENVAPKGARQIVVTDADGKRQGVIALRGLKFPDTGERLYSFGALADVHVVYDTAEADLRRALVFYENDPDVEFVCICGDLTDKGTETQLTTYKSIVDGSGITKPIYAITGNHEYYRDTSSTFLQSYTGQPLCYTVEKGNDVFIMVGIASATTDAIFMDGTLQWLYETLEANRNKRCFLFEHILLPGGSGDILALYPYAKLASTEGEVFKSLLRHYKNVVFFHGHSHMRFSMQQYGMTANYDNMLGCHSVHIPSCAVPRDDTDGDGAYDVLYDGSEGYIVDVYPNGIYLRGRDFVAGKYLPIASYWLDTTLQTVEAGTYIDSTGTITTVSG